MKKTNKLISILLVLAMLLSMAPLTVLAATVEASGKFGASGSNLTWSLDGDGVLTVSGSGAMEDFASVSKVPWYSKRAKIKTVVIESGVTNIGKDAFYGISSLVNATISDTVTSIGNRAFSGSGLTNFEFSDAGNLKTIGNAAFSNTQIKNMVIPDGVTTLGSYVFGYGPIKSVTIPASVTSVGNYFFEETSSLNEVIFLGNKEPENVGDTVFLGCSSLAYVSVPADYEGDTFSNMKVSKAAASVAEVNGQGFATLADAISAAQSISGAVLKLLSHISIDSGITIESGNFTIDLNGKELFSNGYFLLRVDGADVTIIDSAGGGILNATNDQGNIVLEVLSGSANISGGTFNSAGYPATVRNGTLKLTGKDFVLNGNCRIGWYGGNVDLSACTADEVRIQACADGLQASAVTLPDGWGLFETDGTPCTELVKNDIYVAKAGFKVTASVNPTEGGTVEGAGTYSSGATVTLTASAANGYRFVNWIENGEEVSASAVYTFTSSGNREFTANFEIVPHTHSFTYSASGDTITAVCANADGNCPDPEGTLTILPPADLYVDGTTKEATVENNLPDASAAVGDITYSTTAGTAPFTAGTHFASVTVGGATATVKFTLIKYPAMVTDKDGNELSGSPYKTLADAITAASASEGSTVTLLDNITLTSTQIIYSGKFTLDLNGKTLLNETGVTLQINKEANVTVKNSGEGGTVKTGGTNTPAISNLGTLTVDAGNIIGKKQAVNSSGTLTVNGGKFEAEYSLYISSGETVIEDGEFNGIVCVFASCTVNGGDFTAPRISINYEDGILTVNGGTFDIDEIRILAGTVSLAGGEFTNGFVLKSENTEDTLNSFLAEGYKFYDADGNKITVADDAKIIDGYVQVKEHFVASVTDKDGNAVGTYKTFADAITAAQGSEGSTVTLLDDITLTAEQVIRSGKLTLDLNGNNLVNETDRVLYIFDEADFTIKDSGENGTIEIKYEYMYCIVNYGKLTVESGIIKGDGGIDNEGVLYFNDGTVETDYYSAIVNYSGGTVYIYDGVLKSSNSGAIQNIGTLYVYGGEIDGFYNEGTAYISGGKIDRDNHAALNLLGGTVEVTGGSFTGTDNEYGHYSGTPYGEWTVRCTEGATLTIKGGEFPNGFVIDEKTANTLLAEGYYYKDADGKLIDVAEDAKIINGYVKVSKGADLADAVITLDETQFTYSGVEHKPTVIVTIGGKTLTEGKDYTLTFANNVNAGTATVTIKAVGQAAGGIAGGGEDIGNSSNSGDITENVYTGEATKEFTINKKPVTVTATAPDKVYDGTTDIEISEIVISFDGIVEGDTVGYTIKDAWYNGIVVGTDWFVPIVYNVTGEDANNYMFPEGGEYIAPDYFVEATADITAKDISDGFIILGDPLTYNGKEQTQTVEKVLPTGTAPEATYTVSGNKATNVGVYLLTVTGTGNFTGEAKIAYEIAVDMNGVDFDRLHPLNVKATDREKIEYIYNQVDNAFRDYADEAKKNEWDNLKSTCVELLKMIESVTDHLDSFKEEVAGYDIDTVTSDDYDYLENLSESEGQWLYDHSENYTEEEIKEFSDALDDVQKLEIRISDVAEEITRITNAVNGYDEATVKYSDYKDILQLIDDIEALTMGKNITDFERADLEELNAKANLLAAKIRSTTDEIARITRAVNAYNIDTVKSSDKADIENLIARIKKLTDGDNITADERANLNELDSILDALLAKIDETADELARLEAEVGKYDEATVKSSDKTDLEQLKADIKALTDGQNITADERAKLENLDATADALLAKIAETTAEYDRVIAAANGYDEATVTSADKDALVQLNDDIYALALTDNVTAEELENLENAHNKVLALLDKLTDISDEIKRIIEAVDKYVFESVKSSDKADIEQLIADIKELLDTHNITADERALLKGADETCTKLIEKIDETVAEINRTNVATNAYDEATVTSADKADIEKLLADIKALTDGDNITDTEREQLNGNEATLKALLDKIGATADEIARIETAVNGYDEESVKSSDKADLEQLIEDIKALTDATNVTEDERTKLGELDATVDSLIKKIDDTAKEIERIENAVSGYDAETVTSADVPELGKLIEDIKALTDGDNLTEDEKAALEEADKAIDELVEKLTEVAEEIKKVDEAVKSYDEETVKSTDSDELAQLKEDIQNLIDSDNTTENEKTALEEMIKDIEGLEEKIDETEEKLEEIKNIENNFNPETVSSDDKAAIEDKIAEIEAVNPDNLTDVQKAEYEEIKAGFESLLDKIEEASKAVTDIAVELEMFDEERVTKFWEDDIEALKAKIDELLADENMGEAEKAKLNEYKAQAEKLIKIINAPKEYFSLRFFYLIWDCLTWKYNGILWLFKQIFAF